MSTRAKKNRSTIEKRENTPELPFPGEEWADVNEEDSEPAESSRQAESSRRTQPRGESPDPMEMGFADWKKEVDGILVEKIGATTNVFPRLDWGSAHDRGVLPTKAAQEAISHYREKREEARQKKRRRLWHLVEVTGHERLVRWCEASEEMIIKDALLIAGSTQQERIEDALEALLLQDNS